MIFQALTAGNNATVWNTVFQQSFSAESAIVVDIPPRGGGSGGPRGYFQPPKRQTKDGPDLETLDTVYKNDVIVLASALMVILDEQD